MEISSARKWRAFCQLIALAVTFGITFFPTAASSTATVPNTARRLLMVPQAKEEALNGLEDALLEPPRELPEMATSTLLRSRAKYLPDLTGDTLDGYPRRVFIDVGVPGGGDDMEGWFRKHYPTRNRMFEVIRVETAEEEMEGMTEWLGRNIGEDDYVVMKAEAEVVEELLRSGAIGLVDELFLECRHRWEKTAAASPTTTTTRRRPYWECLALYGKLRDRGVAVHQWWG